MTTTLLTQKDIHHAAQILKNGGVVAVRTETVWGLAANLENGRALFSAKNRPPEKNLVMQTSLKEATVRFADMTPAELKFLKKFKKGLTVVLQNGQALRIPADPITKKLLKSYGAPLYVTSANVSGQPDCLTWQSVNQNLGGRINAIIMAKPCKIGKPSTIIKIDGDRVRILRKGAIPEQAIIDFSRKVIV